MFRTSVAVVNIAPDIRKAACLCIEVSCLVIVLGVVGPFFCCGANVMSAAYSILVTALDL